jgi:hypothetical protein
LSGHNLHLRGTLIRGHSSFSYRVSRAKCRPVPLVSPSLVPPLWQRLLWFVGLWAGGVVSIGAVAMAIRWALHP